jgi:hypothetical protein
MRVYLLGWDTGEPRPITECATDEILAAMQPEPNRIESDLTTFDIEAWNEQARIVLSLKHRGLLP